MSTLGEIFREPLVLAALFVGIAILAAAFIVAWAWKSKGSSGKLELIQTLMGIRTALEFNREAFLEQERKRTRLVIDDAVHDMGQGFARELDVLGRAAGLQRVDEGLWERPVPEPLVFRPNLDITDAAVGSVQLVTAYGFAAALRDHAYAPLPLNIGSTDPYEIASAKEEALRSGLWAFELWYIAQCGYKGENPWEQHPTLRGCTWHEVIRADLIEQCGWALILDIENQYPPIRNHQPYLDWKAAQSR